MSVIQPSACCGGVMLSPQEQKTTIGDLMFRRSICRPSRVRRSPAVNLFPTNRLSAIHCISPAFIRIGLPHQVSNARNLSVSVSTFEYTLYGFWKSVLAGSRDSKLATRLAPSNFPPPRSPERLVSHVPPSKPPR